MSKIFLLALAASFISASCNLETSKFFNDGQVEIKNRKLDVAVSDDPQELRLGLSVVSEISESQGMLFVYDGPSRPNFWMKDMKFPIDIVWIRSNRVADLSLYLEPEPGKKDRELNLYAPSADVDMVLEVTAGWVTANNVQIGDEVKIIF
ncbi:MAG: DUF192 domain-containing protein [Candidatus Doudnabacteria bacterium]|nr:DUF192 domain-containing protein [Candidatus Doudnabacteria bacterium]